MTRGRAHHTATMLPNGKVLVEGDGWAAAANLRRPSAELYDPVARTWTAADSLVTKRCDDHTPRCSEGKVVVAGERIVRQAVSCSRAPSSTTPGPASPVLRQRLRRRRRLLRGHGRCQAQKAPGDACDLAADCLVAGCAACATGHCTGGLCCDGRLVRRALHVLRRRGAPRNLQLLPAGALDTTGPTTCTGANACDGAGQCNQGAGQPCPSGPLSARRLLRRWRVLCERLCRTLPLCVTGTCQMSRTQRGRRQLRRSVCVRRHRRLHARPRRCVRRGGRLSRWLLRRRGLLQRAVLLPVLRLRRPGPDGHLRAVAGAVRGHLPVRRLPQGRRPMCNGVGGCSKATGAPCAGPGECGSVYWRRRRLLRLAVHGQLRGRNDPATSALHRRGGGHGSAPALPGLLGGPPRCAGACDTAGQCAFPDVGAACGLCSACDGTGRCTQAPADDTSCGRLSCSGLTRRAGPSRTSPQTAVRRWACARWRTTPPPAPASPIARVWRGSPDAAPAQADAAPARPTRRAAVKSPAAVGLPDEQAAGSGRWWR